jgi:hypothetical protein
MATKRTATNKALKAKPKKEVTFKDLKSFIRAALAKKLPRGTSVVVSGSSFVVDVKGKPIALDWSGPPDENLVDVLRVLGVKATSTV